jgi:hypothetical protein
MLFNSAIRVIAAAATLGVIARPWNSPEFVRPIARVATLVMFGDLTVGARCENRLQSTAANAGSLTMPRRSIPSPIAASRCAFWGANA